MSSFLRSLPRHFISAIVSLFRNFAMTFSALFAVTVTLVMLSGFILLIGNVNNLTDNIQQDLKIHVVLEQEVTSQEDIDHVQAVIEHISGVSEVTFSNKDQELQFMIEERGEELKMYENDNPLSHAFYVKVEDGEQIAQVSRAIATLDEIKDCEYGGNSVHRLVKTLNYIKYGGLAFLGLLGLLVIFLIQSTIKITIESRGVEISIMRQVGAANWYIKIPFLIEGMLIGAIGSIIPCLFSYYGYQFVLEATGGYLISSIFEMVPLFPFVNYVNALLLLIGVTVGLIGSLISTHKYLKFKR